MHSARTHDVIRIALTAIALLTLGCGGTKTPLRVLPAAPRDAASAALGVTLSLTDDPAIMSPPAVVVFARFDDPARDADALRRAHLIESNFTDGNHYYLLNAAPGAYAVVGARTTSKYKGTAVASEQRPRASDSLQTSLSFDFGTQHTRHDEIWFAREMIAATLVDVPVGAFSFAGELQITASKALSAGDAAQSALLSRRESATTLSMSSPTVHRDVWFGELASVRKDAEATGRFRDVTHVALGSAGWSAQLHAARDLQASSGLRGAVPAINPTPPVDSLAELGAWLAGSFSSEAQAARDTSFLDIRLHIVRIWPQISSAMWFYVEQATAKSQSKPYRQRVYRLAQLSDGRFESAVYTLNSPLRFTGMWQEKEPLATLTPDSLVARDGCSVFLRREPDGFYRGSTYANDCPSNLRGAASASSEVALGPHGMVSLDRGWNAAGVQVWGSTAGGYEFRRVGEEP